MPGPKHFVCSNLADSPKAFCGLLLALLCGCSPEPPEKGRSLDEVGAAITSVSGTEQQIDCGNLITDRQILAYVDLARSIHQSTGTSSITDERLFAANVTLIQDGQVTRMTRNQIVGYPGAIPSLHDWRAIASALASGRLESGGWRGCFLSSGKAAFEADGKGGFGLSSFDFDRQWELK